MVVPLTITEAPITAAPFSSTTLPRTCLAWANAPAANTSTPINDSRIFSTGEGHLLGENNNDISAVLENNHKIFSTKEDYLAGRFTLPDEKEIAAYCESLQAGFTMSVYKGFVPSKITLCFKPVFCICFYFTLDGVEQNPLILIPGQKVECCSLYKENSVDFIEFLRRNGLGQFIVEAEELPSMDCFILDGDEL